MDTVIVFSDIRKSFDYEEDIYNNFEKDVLELIFIYLKLKNK